jgi:hypothetical protein
MEFWWRAAMRMLRAGWLLVLLTACGSDTGASVDDPREEVAVRELIGRYYQDFNKNNWGAVAGHFWSNADITTVWQEAGESSDRVVHTSIETFFTDAPRENPFGEMFETWEIRANVSVYRDLAQAWVWYGARFDDAGEVVEWDGVDAFTFLKHDGVWKIASLMFASGDS